MASVTWRLFVAAALLLLGATVLYRASQIENLPTRTPLALFPFQIGPWRGRTGGDFDERVLKVLRVTEYLNRSYLLPDGHWAGLYVGYYASQRQRETMHSPLNCLPGAGWQPVEKAHKTLSVMWNGAPRQIEINELVIEKGLDRQIVQYWYQSRDRVVASEYWGKVYLVADAIRHNRTDGALVRVMVPVEGRSAQAISEARAQAAAFVQALFPHLERHLPL
jgi:EpsI family protein